MRVGGKQHAPAVQFSEKRPGTQREAGWAPGRVRKMSPPPGFDPQTIQPVANRCYYNKIMTNMAEGALEATACSCDATQLPVCGIAQLITPLAQSFLPLRTAYSYITGLSQLFDEPPYRRRAVKCNIRAENLLLLAIGIS